MNPQGSRAGLITAVVILSILFVTSAIFAFYFSAENSKTEQTLKERETIITQYASDAARSDPNVQALATDAQAANKSAIELLNDQKNALARAITGNATEGADRVAKAALAAAADPKLAPTGVTLTQNDGLATAVTRLADRLRALGAENQQKDKQLADATTRLKAEADLRQKMQQELGAKFEQQGADLAAALAQLTEFRNQGTASVSKIQTEAERAMKEAQQQASKLQQELTNREGEIAKLQKQVETLNARVPRPEKTNEAMVRKPDGRILRVPGNDNVFIDLGQGSGIAPGMTFEVYDRFGGIPGLGADPNVGSSAAEVDESTLPQGKASIEVVRIVGPQAECRIIRQTQGQTILEGDLISNVVYDRNAKLNIVVFGDFDLDRDGVPTPGDADVIRDRVRAWGGNLVDAVNVNTDVVVLGYEPEVPPQEEGESPTDLARREAAQKALEAYEEVRDRAIDLNIPILNQNRFLYYTGYYEQSQR
jgi:hypothetical protein